MIQAKAELFCNGEPVTNPSLLIAKDFNTFGILIAQSILQGGPSPNVMSGSSK